MLSRLSWEKKASTTHRYVLDTQEGKGRFWIQVVEEVGQQCGNEQVRSKVEDCQGESRWWQIQTETNCTKGYRYKTRKR